MVLFDFGGVIAPEGFQLGILKLAQKFDKTFRKMYEIAGYRAGLDNGYTAGKATEDDYWKTIADILDTGKNLKKYRYVYLDNFQPRKAMLDLIRKINNEYEFKLGIFSDQTNWIYELDDEFDFFKYFDYFCISYDKGYTKHDQKFYDIPARETEIPPKNILLFDDKIRVIESARDHGMQARLFTSIKDSWNYFYPQNKYHEK